MVRVGWLLLLMWLAGSPAVASDDEEARRTLKGLRGVAVLIESLEPGLETQGLSRTMIQTDVELKLRQAGIVVLSPLEARGSPGSPALHVTVTALQHSGLPGVFALSVDVEMLQNVALVRDRGVTLLAPTWSPLSAIVVVGRERFADTVRGKVRDAVDQFVNAFLAVNPKR